MQRYDNLLLTLWLDPLPPGPDWLLIINYFNTWIFHFSYTSAKFDPEWNYMQKPNQKKINKISVLGVRKVD